MIKAHQNCNHDNQFFRPVQKIAIDKPDFRYHNARLDFGGVPERSKGADCKSVGTAFEGSNPSPSTKSEWKAVSLERVGQKGFRRG